jgi:hypothetical protein
MDVVACIAKSLWIATGQEYDEKRMKNCFPVRSHIIDPAFCGLPLLLGKKFHNPFTTRMDGWMVCGREKPFFFFSLYSYSAANHGG